jgi:hypothetical protein
MWDWDQPRGLDQRSPLYWTLPVTRSAGPTYSGRARGINNAVKEAETTLKIIYDRATQKHSDTSHEVVWALADRHSLRRQTTEIYEKSYLPINARWPGRRALSTHVFSDRLNTLKTPRHGKLWYQKARGDTRSRRLLFADMFGSAPVFPLYQAKVILGP